MSAMRTLYCVGCYAFLKRLLGAGPDEATSEQHFGSVCDQCQFETGAVLVNAELLLSGSHTTNQRTT